MSPDRGCCTVSLSSAGSLSFFRGFFSTTIQKDKRLTDSSHDPTNQAEEISVPGHWVRLLGVWCGQCRHNGDRERYHSEGHHCSK